jgi:hypothetical protein
MVSNMFIHFMFMAQAAHPLVMQGRLKDAENLGTGLKSQRIGLNMAEV